MVGSNFLSMPPALVFMDSGPFRFDLVRAAAGSPYSVFAIEPARLRDARAIPYETCGSGVFRTRQRQGSGPRFLMA